MEKVKELKVVPLMEDNLCEEGMVAEHGLSFYIETNRHKLIVDTGQSDKTWDNARAKGIDLS
ncbi:7,8-dihydropterin-6-yl-methyl-4-(beta-D-ribofuranosyl)aminobenzene 5'-phosphate synthase, partial [Lachnospiraceae bacterium KHCPX20]